MLLSYGRVGEDRNITVINGDDGLKCVELRYESLRSLQDELGPFLAGEGFFLKNELSLAPSDVLRFKIMLPGDFILVEGVGVVIWVRSPEESGPKDPPGTALGFATLSEQGRELIERMVQTHQERGGTPFDLTRPTSSPMEPREEENEPEKKAATKFRFSVRKDLPEAPSDPDETALPATPAEEPEDETEARLPFPEEAIQASAEEGQDEVPGSDQVSPDGAEDNGTDHSFDQTEEQLPEEETFGQVSTPPAVVSSPPQADVLVDLTNRDQAEDSDIPVDIPEIGEADLSGTAHAPAPPETGSPASEETATPWIEEATPREELLPPMENLEEPEPRDLGLPEELSPEKAWAKSHSSEPEDLQSGESRGDTDVPDIPPETNSPSDALEEILLAPPDEDEDDQQHTVRVPSSPNLDVFISDEGVVEVASARKKRRALLRLVGLLFLAGIAGAAGWWAWQNYGEEFFSNPTSSSDSINTPVPERGALPTPSPTLPASDTQPEEKAGNETDRVPETSSRKTPLPGETSPPEPGTDPDTPKTESASLKNAGRILDVAFKAEETGITRIRISADGKVGQNRVKGSILSRPPRYLLRINGIRSPFKPLEIPVGTPQVEKIRFGYHAETHPASLWIVFDLENSGIKLRERTVENSTIELSFGE